ncbi:hypothetical protein LCGC14_2392450, partial [marine sediment metagenome]
MRRVSCVVAVMLISAVGGCGSAGPVRGWVRGWVETVVIPTYPVGAPSEMPNFDRRDIYPYGRQDDLSFERRDVKYQAYMVENEYLRIEVLPAIGGRLFAIYVRVTGQDNLGKFAGGGTPSLRSNLQNVVLRAVEGGDPFRIRVGSN